MNFELPVKVADGSTVTLENVGFERSEGARVRGFSVMKDVSGPSAGWVPYPLPSSIQAKLTMGPSVQVGPGPAAVEVEVDYLGPGPGALTNAFVEYTASGERRVAHSTHSISMPTTQGKC